MRRSGRLRTLPRGGRGGACARCSLCGAELARGERGWYINGRSVCEDCFPAFAREELAGYEITFGGEDTE